MFEGLSHIESLNPDPEDDENDNNDMFTMTDEESLQSGEGKMLEYLDSILTVFQFI